MRNNGNSISTDASVRHSDTNADYLTTIFKFISKQTFENTLDLEPRICKLVITLLLLGVEKNELLVIFDLTPKLIHKYCEFTKKYVKERYEKT